MSDHSTPSGHSLRPTLFVNGESIEAKRGETILAALLRNGDAALTGTLDKPRGAFCNMGVCMDCLVQVSFTDGEVARQVRACQSLAVDGSRIVFELDE